MEKNKKKKLNLTTVIFISLILGAITGIILHKMPLGGFRDKFLINGLFYIIGNGFLRAMQMLVVPLVFCSLVCGSMSIGDSKTLGKVGIKTIFFYLVTTALAITVALTIASIMNPGMNVDLSKVQAAKDVGDTVMEKTSIADTLLNIIPQNPIKGLAEGNMLQIIFFALLLGLIIAGQGERMETVANFFNQFNDIMMMMTGIIMKAAPVGVFCLIAKTFSVIGLDAIMAMIKYMITVFGGLAIQCLVVYMVLLKIFTGLNPLRFLKKFFPVMQFAFSTATSNATIPLSIDTLDKKMGVSRRISSFTIPLGATVNMDGTAIMQGVAVVFVAQAFHIPLTPMDYLTVIATATLASIGTAGVPSVGLITLTMVFASVGLPVEGISFVMGIDRILDMTRTAVNITGDAVCTTIVAVQDKAFNKEVFDRDMTE